VVPVWQFDDLCVGYEAAKRAIDEALNALEVSGAADPLFIKGEWGTGKSLFLSVASTAAIRQGFACARIDLNAHGAALSHPQRFLPHLVDNIAAKQSLGVRNFIYDLLERDSSRSSLRRYACTQDAGELSGSLLSLCGSYEAGERLELGNHSAWRTLQGADLSWSDHASKRQKALDRIGALASLCRAAGLKGLVLLFDEAETVDQLWNVRSRVSAYSVLGRLCRTRHLWCVFGVTARFERTIEKDIQYAEGHVDQGSDAGCFLRHWQDRRFPLIRPPTIDSEAARTLARRIASLYADAYGTPHVDADLIKRCLEEWRRNPGRNPRRLVRALIHALDSARPIGWS
jgi:hypothetical protein